MRLLLDSHVFVWVKSAPENLSAEARAAIIDPDNEAFVSVASAWELWLKHAKKPIAGFGPVLGRGASGFLDAAVESGIVLLEITLDHAFRASALPRIHRDPFDRMLIAQAIAERLIIVTGDPAFRRYKGLRVFES
ncbi:MAG: type II toxin-antitoxin system VapC family toxin [Acidobacteria bacterium]|nr:type II toxin-antitoxin system VapC family toxin [Acidobacteriota bacterium]